MSELAENRSDNFVELTVNIVSAYVSNNSIPTSEVPGLIWGICNALQTLTTGTAAAAPEAVIEKPSAAQIRKSVTPDGIVSFLDGKTYKTLKRHLRTHGLDPHSYRVRYGLPPEYPMVASAYIAHRSELAKSMGLGRIGRLEEGSEPKVKGRGKAA